MTDKISSLLAEVEQITIQNKAQLEELRIKWLSKKGEISVLFDDFKTVPNELKKEVGQRLNELKVKATEKINSHKEVFEQQETANTASSLDLSLPGIPLNQIGSKHPLSIVKNQIIEIFSKIGFTVSDGREIEDDWHNFSALNTPQNHPARDMQDTFYINLQPDTNHYNGPLALRTHTSSVQVRVMEHQRPPIRTICPGRVYRNEAISARAHCFFHQVEGLYIDEEVSFADLKQTLYFFVKEMYGADVKVRFRPSYFPFTEPSAEMDISCFICKGQGCTVCKKSGWVEILGCGMVHPNVLSNCGIDPEKYSGFAFGLGVERPAMLKYGVNDLRLFSENDVRFLRQFAAAT